MSRLKGSAALEKRLLAIPQEVLAGVRPALVKGAEEVAANMRALVPVDEGDLKASIAVTGPGETTPPYAVGGGSVTAAPPPRSTQTADLDARRDRRSRAPAYGPRAA